MEVGQVTDAKNDMFVRSEAEQASNVLIRIRRKLYVFSAITITYILYGLNVRLSEFDNGLRGFGFESGIALEGVTEELFRWIMLTVLGVLTVRFMWFSLIVFHAMRSSRKYNGLTDQFAPAFDPPDEYPYESGYPSKLDEMSKEQMETYKGHAPTAKHIYGTMRWFRFYQLVNVVIFPLIIPLSFALFAIILLVLSLFFW